MYLDKFRLDGRRALVTAGARGIGLACAQALTEAGAAVTIADRDPVALDQGAQTLRAAGHGIDTAMLDVTDSAAVTALADRLGAVDILVNNAGIARSDTPAEEVADEHWLNVVDVNLNGSFWCARAFGRHMLAAGRGGAASSTSDRCRA